MLQGVGLVSRDGGLLVSNHEGWSDDLRLLLLVLDVHVKDVAVEDCDGSNFYDNKEDVSNEDSEEEDSEHSWPVVIQVWVTNFHQKE